MLVVGCGTNNDNGNNGTGSRNGNTVGTRSTDGGRYDGRNNTIGQDVNNARDRTGDANDDVRSRFVAMGENVRNRVNDMGNDARDRMGNLGNDVQGLGESGFGLRGLADQLGLTDDRNRNGGRRSSTSPNGDDAGAHNGVNGYGTDNTGNSYTGKDAGYGGLFNRGVNRSGIIGYGTNGTTDLYGTARTGLGSRPHGVGANVGLMIGNAVVVADSGSLGGRQSNGSSSSEARVWKVTDQNAINALKRVQQNMNGMNPKAKAAEIARDIGYILKHVKAAD